MVDVDRRMTGLTPSTAAGLRRLSARASAPSTPTTTSSPAILNGVLTSFSPLAASIISHLRSSSVPLAPGLCPHEFALAEARFGFHFPPDLRAVLALALPVAPGFPNWRTCDPSTLHQLHLPTAAVAVHVSNSAFWSKSWGPRPSDPDRAVGIARSNLKRSPLLIPLFDRCYLPSLPCLAGNPVFLVGDSRISLCGTDLADFFDRQFLCPAVSRNLSGGSAVSISSSRKSIDSVSTSSSGAGGKTPRWIEFWSDAAASRRRRTSSSSDDDPLPSPESFVEIRNSKIPRWVGTYLSKLGSVLRDGGWDESDVEEMIHVSSVAFTGDGETSPPASFDQQSACDAFLLKADRFSGSLRRAGWSSDEVSDAFKFDFRPRKERKRVPVTLPPEILRKIDEIAAAVS